MTVEDQSSWLDDGRADNPLLATLQPEEFSLLSIIWATVSNASSLGHEVVWPIWDYVAREFYARHPDVSDAESILSGMPSLPGATWRDSAYGLVWKNESSSFWFRRST